jgi:parallel beta-helix repeat protein
MRSLPTVFGLCAALTALHTPYGLLALAADPPAAESHGSSPAVRDFGTVADGHADDTAAIQKAVDTGCGDIRFTRGVYRITKPIIVNLNQVGPASLIGSGTARIVMAGPGPAIKLLGTHTGTADPPTVKPEVLDRQRMPTIDGLEIVGAHPEAVGIEADGTMQLIVTRVNVRRCLHGIHLVGRNRNVIVSDCHLYHNGGVGLYLDNVNLHQINVAGCHVSYNAGGGIVSRAGNVRNLQVAGCDIEANVSGKTPTANVLIDCTGSPDGAAEVAVTGCTLQHNCSPGSANLRFVGGGKSGRRWGHLTLANNILSDVQVNVDIQQARGVVIVGNTLGKAAKYDLRIVDSSSVVVGPNCLDRNPNYQEDAADGGVLLQNCQDMTLSGLHVTQVRRQPAGLTLDNCCRVNLTGCTILDCDNAGILLKGVSDSRVSGCLIQNKVATGQPWTAIKSEGGNGNVIEGSP